MPSASASPLDANFDHISSAPHARCVTSACWPTLVTFEPFNFLGNLHAHLKTYLQITAKRYATVMTKSSVAATSGFLIVSVFLLVSYSKESSYGWPVPGFAVTLCGGEAAPMIRMRSMRLGASNPLEAPVGEVPVRTPDLYEKRRRAYCPV